MNQLPHAKWNENMNEEEKQLINAVFSTDEATNSVANE